MIVISTLLAIMDTQAKELNRIGISACCLHDEESQNTNSNDLRDGKFHIVFGTPEAWLQGQWWKMLHFKIYQQISLEI